MAKVKIGAYEPTINSVKITVPDEKKNFNEVRTLVEYSEKCLQGQTTDPFTEGEYNCGLTVEMDMDEMAQSVAFLRDQTNGRQSATMFVKRMIATSPDILDDEVVNMAIECLKACRLRIDDGCIDHLCKGLEALLSEYKAEL